MTDLVKNLFPAAPPEGTERLIIRIPGASLHLIKRSCSVELACGDLSILCLVQDEEVVAVLASVNDKTQWRLTKDDAAVKIDDSRYIFPFDERNESYRLSFASKGKGQEYLLKVFDGILQLYSCFSVEKEILSKKNEKRELMLKYEGVVDWQESRQKRVDSAVEMWKSKREEILEMNRWTFDVEKKLEHLLDAGVWCTDSILLHERTTEFRKLLSNSIEWSLPITEVVKANAVPFLVQFLIREDFPLLQFEAALALTLISSRLSRITKKVVIDSGAVPMFVKLLASTSDDVRKQAVWALGNIAGDSPVCRDHVLRHGALIPLLRVLNEHAKLSLQRIATWTLSNFCWGKPEPPIGQSAIPALAQLICSDDEEVLINACRALSDLSDGTNDNIQAVIKIGVCPRLVELLEHPSPSVLITALRIIGNIVTGDDMHTKRIIKHQALPCLLKLLTNNYEKNIKKEACWTISNITAGNKEQIQAVIEAKLIGPLVNLLQDAEFDIKKEAASAISNATSGGAHEEIEYLVSQGCIKPLCDLLIYPDPGIVTICLEGLGNIWKVGEANKDLGNTRGVNIYAQRIDDAEAVIEAYLIGPLVNLLRNAEFDIKKKFARAIAHAASGGARKKIKDFVSRGCIKLLCDLLIYPDPRIVMVCLEGLENILKVGEANKDLGNTGGVNIYAQTINDAEAVIEANLMGLLVNLLRNAECDIKKKFAWAISHAAASGGAREQIKYRVSQGCIKLLCDLLIYSDPRIVIVCLEGLENILKVGEADKNLGNTGGVNIYAQMINDAEGLEKIENLKSHDNTEVYEKAVKILETMPPGDASQTGFHFGGSELPSGGSNFI